MQNNNDRLKELKSLLFDEEIDTFKRLEKKLDQLDFSLNNREKIIFRILPLLDDLLLTRLKDKEGHTVEIYAEYLATIINNSAKQDLHKLSKSLQSIISPAISKEIEDNKDKMVDTLYPILGGMISKYVTNAIQEMMQSINKKIEDGLSLNQYKRKVKSKVSGVSESEILLHDSNHAEIRALFIIQKESGLLIAEEHLENQEIDDPHMVASMAGAIKDFVNDWISSNKKVSEVQLLSYGNQTLYIESAGSVYLIAFLNSEPNHEERNNIQKFFVNIMKKHTPFFHKFDGDDSAIDIVNMKKNMKMFLNKEIIVNQAEEKKKSIFIKSFFLLLLIPLVIYLGYFFQEKYNIYLLEEDILIQTGEHIVIKKSDDILTIEGHVQTIEGYSEVEQLLTHKGYKNIVNKVYLSLNILNKNIIEQKNKLGELQKSILLLQKELKKVKDK